MIKKALKFLGIAVGGLLGAGLGFYLIAIRPMTKEIEKVSPQLEKTAAGFISCMESQVIEKCDRFTSDRFKRTISNADMLVLSKKIRNVIGLRVSGELVKDSLAMDKTAVQGEGYTKVIRGQFKAIYEKGPFVTEWFSFSYDASQNTYKVLSFRVDSKEFIK